MQRNNISSRFYQALVARRQFNDCNTVIYKEGNTLSIFLHHNLIARLRDGKSLYVTFAGWSTPTTAQRLTNILDAFTSNWRANIINGVGTFSYGKFFQTGDVTIDLLTGVAVPRGWSTIEAGEEETIA